MLQLLPIVLAFAAQRAAAHGGVIGFGNGGNYYPGWRAYNSEVGQVTIARPYATFDPIENVNAATLSCNNNGQSGPSQLTATVEAGSDITFFWNQWPHNTGPVITYLAQCPGTTCTGVDSSTLKWFKIDEAGLLSGSIATGTWAAAAMMANNNSWTSTIPSSVPSGDYLIRHETIALHSLPAQMYPECAQIKIVNGGNRAPTADELVTFPGGYSATDPGLTVNLYSGSSATTTTYVVPGPPLYGSGTGSIPKPSPATPSSVTSSSAPVKTSSAAPVVTSSAAPVKTSSSAAPAVTTSSAAPVATGSVVAQWGQCGGISYTGSTTCASPFVCTKINDYYSQCLTGALSSQFSSSSAPTVAQPTSSAAPSPDPAVGIVPHYGQCGGINHKGDTACAAPFTCVVQNKYYSQCI